MTHVDLDGAGLETLAVAIDTHGGQARFVRYTLQRLDGSPVSDAKIIGTKYGLKWLVGEDTHSPEWIKYQPYGKSLTDKGYKASKTYEVGPAKAIMHGDEPKIIRDGAPRSDGWLFVDFEGVNAPAPLPEPEFMLDADKQVPNPNGVTPAVPQAIIDGIAARSLRLVADGIVLISEGKLVEAQVALRKAANQLDEVV